MYQTMNIQSKVVYIRWTNSPDLLTNLILLKGKNHENSMENYVNQMYRSFGFVKKKKLNSLSLQNRENSMENPGTYQIMKIQWKIVYV